MTTTRCKSVHMRVQFPERACAKPAFDDWGRDHTLSVQILRGRITQTEATFDIQVTGPSPRIKDFLRRGHAWGASLGPSSTGVA